MIRIFKTEDGAMPVSYTHLDANRALGLTNMEHPLLRIVTLALPVIPDAKMSDMGLVQVTAKRIVPLFPE